jgi:hypothetical protein
MITNFVLEGPNDAPGVFTDRFGYLLEFDDNLDFLLEGQLCQLAAPLPFFQEDHLRGELKSIIHYGSLD